MSNFRAISGVSASLKRLLRDQMEDLVEVTIASPDAKNMPAKRLNLYLYQVTKNGYLENQEMPGDGHPSAYGHPPLSLDLHYLLTAYGGDELNGESDLKAQQILGDAMRVLHDLPFVTDNLKITRSAAGTVGDTILDDSLLGEFERIKVTLQPMALEDFSKIWTALPNANFRCSVAYQVSAVQIESQRLRSFPKPVGEPPPAGPRVFVVPFRSPEISEIRVRRPNDSSDVERPLAYARIGDTLILRGRNFAADTMRVMLGEMDATSRIVPPRRDDRIEVTIPDNVTLQPGPQQVKVVLDVMMGKPPRPHLGFQSNLAVFMLVPWISDLNLSNTKTRALRIQGERLFLDSLGGETLLGPALISKSVYHSPQQTEITVLPDMLPAWPAKCLISGELTFPISLSSPREVEVKIEADGPPSTHTATLSKSPETLSDAAQVLQAAIRKAPGGDITFKGTRVTTLGNQLVLVPGGLGGEATISVTPLDNSTAEALELSTLSTGPGGARFEEAYLSGELAPFPRLTAINPAVSLTLGSSPKTVLLTTLAAASPLTVAEAASLLQEDIVNAGFSNVRVTTLENQLLILPRTPGVTKFEFDKVAGTDETTVAELQLSARYPVRVRVDGAESIDERDLELP